MAVVYNYYRSLNVSSVISFERSKRTSQKPTERNLKPQDRQKFVTHTHTYDNNQPFSILKLVLFVHFGTHTEV